MLQWVFLLLCEWSYPPSGVVCGLVPAPVVESPFPLVFDGGGRIRSSFPGGRAPHNVKDVY